MEAWSINDEFKVKTEFNLVKEVFEDLSWFHEENPIRILVIIVVYSYLGDVLDYVFWIERILQI